MCVFFFFNDTATTEIYTLSLHDALPICASPGRAWRRLPNGAVLEVRRDARGRLSPTVLVAVPRRRDPWSQADRKSTRLNSSHGYISYAVFCLKKKKQIGPTTDRLSSKCI